VPGSEVRAYFRRCGDVSRLRLLGDARHPTQIAFVEYMHAQSAMQALSLSGGMLGMHKRVLSALFPRSAVSEQHYPPSCCRHDER